MDDNDLSQASDDYRRIEKAIRFVEENFRSRPTLDEIADEMKRQEDEAARTESCRSLLTRLLYSNGRNKNFFDSRVVFINDDRLDRAAALAKMDVQNPEALSIQINLSHRLVAKWLEQCTENPVLLYNIALLASSAVAVESRSTVNLPYYFESSLREFILSAFDG